MATQLSLVNQPNALAFSRNPLYFRWKATPWTEEDTSINTRLVVKLMAESRHYQGDFREIFTYSVTPDANGFAWIDVASIMDAQLQFYLPKPKQKNIQLARSQAARFRLEYFLVNDYEQITTVATTDDYTVYKGGLAKSQADPKAFFDQKTILGSGMQFLRFPTVQETIHAEDPVWLTAIAKFNSPTAKLRMTVKVSTGGAFTYDVTTPIGVQTGMLMVIPAGIGPVHHNVAQYGNAIEVSYELRDSNNIIWAKTDFIRLDRRNHYEPERIGYFNSLGGFELLRIFGQVDFSAKYSKENLRRIDVAQFAQSGVVEAEESSWVNGEKLTPKAETGFRTLGEIVRLRDLLNSAQAWEYNPGQFIPIKITGDSYQLYSTEDQLYNLTLSWESANEERNYTPDNYLQFSTVCPDVLFFEVTQVNPKLARISWQLAEGYDLIEVVYSQTNTTTASNLYPRQILEGNTGSVDMNLPDDWTFSPPGFSFLVYFWARTVCDQYSSPMSVGAFTARQTRRIYRFPAPVLRNDFATTYKSADPRALSFGASNSIFANDTPVNGGTLSLVSGSLTGSGGGSLSIDVNGNCIYTPSSASFSGVESFTYTAYEDVGITNSAQDTGKVYVTVESVTGTGIAGIGKPFFRVEIENVKTVTTADAIYTQGRVVVRFYKDPLAQTPYDVSALGITFSRTIFGRTRTALMTTFGNWFVAGPGFTSPVLVLTQFVLAEVADISILYPNATDAATAAIEYKWELNASPDYVII